MVFVLGRGNTLRKKLAGEFFLQKPLPFEAGKRQEMGMAGFVVSSIPPLCLCLLHVHNVKARGSEVNTVRP